MSIAQDNRDGTKGASVPYRKKVLKGLQNISNNTGDLTGLLGSILNAVRAHQEMEILLVRDPNNSDQIVQQIREYDEETDTWSTEYYDVSGAVYTPSVIGDLEYLDASAVLNLILSEISFPSHIMQNHYQ